MSNDRACQYHRVTGERADISAFTSINAMIDFESVKEDGRILLLSAVDSSGRYNVPMPTEMSGFEASGVPVPGLASEVIGEFTDGEGELDILSLDGRFDTRAGDAVEGRLFLEPNYSDCYSEVVEEYAREFNARMIRASTGSSGDNILN